MNATATTPAGNFSFKCEPSGPGGQPIIIGDDMTFSCLSTNSKANLTLTLQKITFTKGDRTETKQALSAILIIPGPPSTVYSGVADLYNYSSFFNRNLNGEFRAAPVAGVNINGTFSFESE